MKRLFTILILFSGVLGFSVLAKAESPAQTAAKLNQLKSEISALERQIDKELGDRESLQRQLRSNDREIAEISLRRQDLQLRIETLQTEAGTLGSKRDGLTAKINESAVALLQLLQEQYRQGETPRLQLLLSDQDPAKLDRLLHYYDQLSLKMRERVNRFEAQLEALNQTNQQLSGTEREIELEREELDTEQRALEAARVRRVKTLAQIEASIDQKQGSLAVLNTNVERLQSVLEQISKSIDVVSLQAEAGEFADRKGKFNWPLSGQVVENYGSERSKDGIVIGTEAGKTVYAVHSGRVVFSEWLRGYGLLLIVDHGQSYMTLYGQNQSLLRHTGDWIGAGDAVAVSGSSGGANESGLYFSIRHKAQSMNPLNWLEKRG